MMFAPLFFLFFTHLSLQWPQPKDSACSKLNLPKLQGFNVVSISATEVYDYAVPSAPDVPASASTTLNFCNLTIAITHGTDLVWEYIWLPLQGWNGRYAVGGGSGLAAGQLSELPGLVAQGYAAGTSDGGLTLNNTIDPQTGLWILDAPGKVNSDLANNFAYRAIHDVATIGKTAAKVYYGNSPKYSYYSGCSTGGRQGYSSAHFFPDDFDGILANAPVIYTTRYSVADVWPIVVMGNVISPPNCIFSHYQEQIISACDALDGLIDGILTDPSKCKFDVQSLVDSVISCSDIGSNITITSVHAEVVAKILQGPRSTVGTFQWYGIPLGASFDALANTITANGTTSPAPFVAAEAYVNYFVFEDPDYQFFNMTFSDFDLAYNLSVTKLSAQFPFDTPDMHDFQKLGKKMLTWHGLADQYVPFQGTIQFREGLEETHGGRDAVNNFQRVFFVPGAQHCASSVGPAPVDNALSVLAAWVENGTAPETIVATAKVTNGTTISRELCLWPKLPFYNGVGDPTVASSFNCE